MIDRVVTYLLGTLGALNDLKKINVVCGQNNSGKSLLLKSITEDSSTRFEYRLQPKFFDLNSNLELIISNKELEGIDELKNKTLKRDYNELMTFISLMSDIKEICQKNKLFLEERKYVSNDILNLLLAKYEILEGKDASRKLEVKTSYNIGMINGLLERLKNRIFTSVTSIVVDAKRKLNTQDSIGNYQLVHNNYEDQGRFLAEMFDAKNKISSNPLNIKYKKLKELFSRISGGVDFEIEIEDKHIQLFFRGKSHEWIKAENSGTGLQEIFYMIGYSEFTMTQLLIIEEPENHIHPTIQRQLLRYFKYHPNHQYIITTHSSVFLDLNYVDRIYVTSFIDGKFNVENVSEKAIALEKLGYLQTDNLVIDTLIIVEGNTDIPVVEEFLRKLEMWNDRKHKILSMGGVSNIRHMDVGVFSAKYKNVNIITDGDKNKETLKEIQRIKSKIELFDNVKLIELEGYGIENYFSIRAVKSVYGKQFDLPENEYVVGNYMNPKKQIKKGLSKSAKMFRAIAYEMTVDEVMNAHDFSAKIELLNL